jgi:hypothetical protein
MVHNWQTIFHLSLTAEKDLKYADCHFFKYGNAAWLHTITARVLI